ncbi:MAG: AAA family ATPase [Candidatus Jordarchaeaceae archaeon]
MLTYDYVIERTMGEGKVRKFVPEKIPKQLGNIVIIEGPNSSGKSTLLNIIALGLYGTRNSRLNQKLQSKMNALINSSHQKVKFSFQITSETDNIVLSSEKPDPERDEIIVREGTDKKSLKVISSENFEKKYNLIYDIPDNPTERLNELLKELKEEQQQVGNKIKDFYFYLDKTIGQISSNRDPRYLVDIKRRLEEAQKHQRKLEEDIPKLQTFLDLLEKRAYIQYYCYYTNEGEKLERERQILEKTIKRYNAYGKKVIKVSKDKNRAATLQNDFKRIYDKLTPLIENNLPRNEKARFTIWKEINPFQTENEDLNKLRFEITHYLDLFGNEMVKMRKDPSFKEATVWDTVFQALKEFENSGLVIPELEVPLGKFVKILKEQYQKSRILVLKAQTINEIIELLQELKNNVKELHDAKKLLEESTETEQLPEETGLTEQKRKLAKIEHELGVLATKCNDYFQRCLSKGIDEEKLENASFAELIKGLPCNKELEDYLSLGEERVMNRIEQLKTEITEKRGELSGLEVVISQYKKELDDLEKRKPHKFEAHLEKLNVLLRKADAMRQKLLSEYNNYIRNLMENKISKSELAKDSKKSNYYREVSKYMAYRVGSFRHIDKIYKAKVVDLIDKTIITDNDETIHMIDMGTGQEQAAYILSLLNINPKNDQRKIIALFDEIAMMDDKTLEPICQRMKELKNQNRLLFGALVQKGNQISVRNL